MAGNEQVLVDKRLLASIMESVIEQLVISVEGSATEDAQIDRKKLCDLVEQAYRRGEKKVFELLVTDLIGIPLSGTPHNEPGWYLTVSLNADVPGCGEAVSTARLSNHVTQD